MKELYGITKQEYIQSIIELLNKCDDLSVLYFVRGFLTKKLH